MDIRGWSQNISSLKTFLDPAFTMVLRIVTSRNFEQFLAIWGSWGGVQTGVIEISSRMFHLGKLLRVDLGLCYRYEIGEPLGDIQHQSISTKPVFVQDLTALPK